MGRDAKIVLAAIQAAPIQFDAKASTAKACSLIAEAAEKGATLAAFGETWLPGYPWFMIGPVTPLTWEAVAEYSASAIDIPGPETDRLCEAASAADVDVVIGVVERDPNTRGTLYCTLLFIGRDGKILGRHRKTKPTFSERSIWADGDAVGLRTYQRPYGRISGLNCWEHNTMLPGYVLAAEGTQIHIAAWPGREPGTAPPAPVAVWPRQLLLSRAFASQASCYVVCVGGVRLSEHSPERYSALSTIEHTGGSFIIDPRGEIVAGPLEGEGILVAEASMELVRAAKAASDIGGHYSRPDLFSLTVNRSLPRRVIDVTGGTNSAMVTLDAVEPALHQDDAAR